MMKRFLYLALLVLFFNEGCKKDPSGNQQNGNLQHGLHIQLLKGNNQTDTIGNPLKDSIIVKITNNGSPVAGYTVQFKRSGCEDLDVTDAVSNTNGQLSFVWYLSGDIGAQSLNAIVLDGNLNHRDSVSVSAMGVASSHGWHRGGCLQNFPVNTVTALSSGRILASVNKASYPYYSDNNAVSWHPLKSFSKNYVVSKIVNNGTDIYLATLNQGVFHSTNNGQNWTNISTGIPNVLNFSDFAVTPSGKLFYTNANGLYESDDKGATWNENDFGLPSGPSTYPCEQSNGDLYIIGSDGSVYQLPAHTGTWISIAADANYLLSSVQSIFIDNSGNIFIGGPHDAPDGTGYIYESSDNGQNWTLVFSQQNTSTSYSNIDNISKAGSSYYFSFAGLGIMQTTNFSTFSNLTAQLGNLGFGSYTIAGNGNLVIGAPGYGVYYKVP